MTTRNFGPIICACFALMTAPAHAAMSSPGWPCVQREVPEISAGMVWTAEPIDADDKAWSSERKVSPVVLQVTSRRSDVEDAIKLIDEFAAGLAEDRKRLLQMVFAGTFQRINVERREIMAGIKRYARRQEALAEQIKKHSVEQFDLKQKQEPTDAERQRIAELEERIVWDTRIYVEREQSLTYVCETPVLLEQRLFRIGRHISELVKNEG